MSGPEIGVECTDIEKLRLRCWLYDIRQLGPKEAHDAGAGYEFGALLPDLDTRRRPDPQVMEDIVATTDTLWRIRLVRFPFTEARQVAPATTSVEQAPHSPRVTIGNPALQISTTPGLRGLHYDVYGAQARGLAKLAVNEGPGEREHCYMDLSRNTLEEFTQDIPPDDSPSMEFPVQHALYRAIPLLSRRQVIGLEVKPPHKGYAEGVINYTTEVPHDGLTGRLGSYAILTYVDPNSPVFESIV